MILGQILNQQLENAAYIIGTVVIILFGIVFIWLAALFFQAKKKNIENNLEDKEIQKEVDEDYHSLMKKKKSNETVVSYYFRKQKRNKKWSIVLNSLVGCIYVLILAGVVFSFFTKQRNQQVWINDQTYLVIETNSMEQAYVGNTYLQDENGKTNSKDRIQQNSLIQISRKQNYIDELQPYDIAAFKMLGSDGKTMITVVHRLIHIDYDKEGNPLYTFRGDANPSTMSGEFQISKDRIVGVFESQNYKGYKSIGMGYLVTYVRSPIGLNMVVISTIIVLLYLCLYDKVCNLYQKKYELMLLEKSKTCTDNG